MLHIDDCQNWVEAGDRVKAALGRIGDVSTPVEFRLLRTAEEAARVTFAGSPTITLDGEDLFPSGGQSTDLACRIYYTPEGLARLPTVEQIVEAIDTHER